MSDPRTTPCPRWCTHHTKDGRHGRFVGVTQQHMVTIYQAPTGAPRISIFDHECSDENSVRDLSADQALSLGHVLEHMYLGSLLRVAFELIAAPDNPDDNPQYLLQMGADPVRRSSGLLRRLVVAARGGWSR